MAEYDSYYWADDFYPSKSIKEKAQARFQEYVKDMIDNIACQCGLDPSEWDRYDYDTFCEIMDLYF